MLQAFANGTVFGEQYGSGPVDVVWLHDVIAANLGAMFPGGDVAATVAFRIGRDADVILQDDEEIDDLLHAMEEVAELALEKTKASRG